MQKLFDFFIDKYGIDISTIDVDTAIEDLICFEGAEGVHFIDDFFTTFNIKVDYFNYKDFIRSDGFMISLPKFLVKERKVLKLKDLIMTYKTGEWSYDD